MNEVSIFVHGLEDHIRQGQGQKSLLCGMGMPKLLLQRIHLSFCNRMIDPQQQGVCGQGNLLKLAFDIQEIRDFFFDGFIADILVQSKIGKAQRQCDDALRQVRQIRGQLLALA